MVYTSAREGISHSRFTFRPGDLLVFGKETSGLPREVLASHPDTCIRIPILGPVRSINLSTAAGIVLYEALRQTGFLDE
jgi:tRNA (cytidine/uridine-2'-O-)-methyltransferase